MALDSSNSLFPSCKPSLHCQSLPSILLSPLPPSPGYLSFSLISPHSLDVVISGTVIATSFVLGHLFCGWGCCHSYFLHQAAAPLQSRESPWFTSCLLAFQGPFLILQSPHSQLSLPCCPSCIGSVCCCSLRMLVDTYFSLSHFPTVMSSPLTLGTLCWSYLTVIASFFPSWAAHSMNTSCIFSLNCDLYKAKGSTAFTSGCPGTADCIDKYTCPYE